MNLIHAAIWVEDLEESHEFYHDVLGLEQTMHHESEDGTRNVYLAGEDGTEVQLRHHPDKLESKFPPSGVDHIEFRVEDTDATVERVVEQTGAEVVKGPFTYDSEYLKIRVAYVQDPNGYKVVFQ